MKTIAEFTNSKKLMTFKECEESTGTMVFSDRVEDGTEIVVVYNEFAYIIKNKSTLNYTLDLGNATYNSKSLKDLERILWDWYKWELILTTEEIEDDLQTRAKELLDTIKETCSLDEVNTSKFDKSVQENIKYLLNEFNN